MSKQTFTAGQVLTAAEMNTLQENDYNWTVSTKTASYVLAAGDEGTRIVMNNAGATTITVNDGVFAAGDVVWIHNIGAGACTITAGTATVNTTGSLELAQYGGGQLFFTSASTTIFFPFGGGATMIKKVDRFTTNGTWTVPTGVTYAVAHIKGGGGGVAVGANDAGDGGSSSVAFASGTVTATGGTKAAVAGSGGNVIGDIGYAGQANSGHGAFGSAGKGTSAAAGRAEDGALIVAGAAVTPAASISITVGAGGSAGTSIAGAAGGSGYVYVEYQQEA